MRSDNPSFSGINARSSKDPRYTIELAFDFANTDLHYFTSHSDAKVPSSSTSTSSVISNNGISGTTQKIQPDRGLASIGNINIRLIDDGEAITTLFNTKLDTGSGLRGKRIRVYTSFIDEVWSNYVLIATQIVDTVSFNKGVYIINCVDIQRSERKNIFDLATTTMSASVTETDYLIPVYSVSGFELLEHGTSYSDATSDFSSSPQVIKTVLYIKVEKEIIRCTGTVIDGNVGLSFVVENDGASPIVATGRGALNTKAVIHEVDTTLADNSRKRKVTEYVYLEMPVPKLIYALLTGNLEGQSGKTLPTKWHLGIDTSYVKLSDFTGIGNDWWDTSDDTNGVLALFEGIKKQDAKKFIETELNLLLGSYNPIYSDGRLGLRRMSSILAGAGAVKVLSIKNVKNYSQLNHDMRSILNSFQINWNWNDTEKDYTRTTLVIDPVSISKHGESNLKNLNFRGLSGQRHTEESIFNLFNSLRDRYAGPPLKIKVDCLPSLNVLEVGDIVRVDLQNVRDFNGALAPLDRSFEVQGVTINWLTGNVSLDLFGSSQSAGALALGTASSVLNDAFYTTLGTELKTYIDGLGSPSAFSVSGGIGHITADITIAGSNPATIYYYDAPLTIDAGVTVTITNNVDLRIKGHITINGTIDGKGQGLAGAPVLDETPPATGGTSGYFGNTQAGGQLYFPAGYYGYSYESILTKGKVDAIEYFTLINNTTANTLSNIPTDLRGCSGGAGGSFWQVNAYAGSGGAGGAGGAGLVTVSRGFSFGVSGKIDLSGIDGSSYNIVNGGQSGTGGGGGGAPGCWLCLLDGTSVTIPNTGIEFVADHGDTPVFPVPLPSATILGRDVVTFLGANGSYSSFYTGYGTPSFDRSDAAVRIQFIPEDLTAVADTPNQTVIPPTVLVLSSGDSDLLKALDGTIISRINVSWTASIDQNIGGYEVEYKLTSATNYTPASNTVNLEITQIFISPVQDGISYDIRVRAINNISVRSSWLSLTSYTVIGKLAAPADCDQFTVQRLSDGTRVFDGGYVPSSNAPVDFAGYEIRAAVGSGLAWSALTALHTGLITQLPFETNQLAAGSYTAGIKAVDTTGIYSTNAVLVDSTLGDPRIKNALVTVDFHADGFPDTKTNSWVDPISGNLIATDQYTWANFATGSPIQTWADWNEWATNPNSPVTYETAAIDIGAILDVTPLLSVTSNGTTVTLQESHSDDNITFTAYANSGLQVNGRYYKFKITITNTSTAVIVTQATVIIDAEVIDEYIEDLDTSTVDLGSPRVAGDIRLPIVKSYSTIKNIQIALQNVGAGWSWEIIDKSVTGPRIKIYNSSNTLSDATIDAYISGA